MIKLVIFDLDGTLVNAYPAVSQSVNYTLKILGFAPRSHAQIKRSVGKGDRKLMELFVGKKLAERAIVLYRPHHARALRQKGAVRLLPGALAILKYLKANKCKLAIASNRPTRFTRIILKQLGVLKFFDVVLCADRAPKPKPYPDILWAITRRLKINKKDALYVGDMTFDVQCGQRAGVKVVAVATGSSSTRELKALKPWGFTDKITGLRKIIVREDVMSKKLRKGKLKWRSKKANHGSKPGRG